MCSRKTATVSDSGAEFTLASVHVLWGKKPAKRLPEITAFAQWMHAWAVRPNDWNSNLIVLGDFNLDRIGDPLYEAFIDDNTRHFYDQLARVSQPDGTSRLKGLTFGQRAGTFGFIPHVYRGLTCSEVSWRISDHYPLWCEFRLA